ncbi:cytochrome P450 [Actinocorallia aurantiaca]|uniref:Cytochrome P450 n=1 Tax=Actinocorallia aurantiaca TaxID=46204 RepID=A0ABN3U5S2_9ACTN
MEQLEVPKMPWKRTNGFHPPEGFAQLREGPPVRVRLPNGQVAWLVTKHADVRAVLSDPRVSAKDSQPQFPMLIDLPPGEGMFSFLRMDDPDHGRLRRLLTAEFTMRRVNAMRPGVEQAVDDLLDAMVEAGPAADLVKDFALPLPSQVICQLLGVPYEDHEFFQDRSAAVLDLAAPPEEVGKAMGELGGYLAALVAEKVRTPSDDLLGRVAAAIPEERLTERELVDMALLLLVAGHETTANMIALGTLTLLQEPGRWAELHADPSLIGSASEELLRYLTIVQFGLARTLLEPLTVGGVTMGAGEGLIASIASANRDGAHFPDPDSFGLGREQGQHLAFGFGMHQCLGAALARLEMNIAFDRLTARFPELRLTIPLEDVPFRYDQFVYGIGSLPVTW